MNVVSFVFSFRKQVNLNDRFFKRRVSLPSLGGRYVLCLSGNEHLKYIKVALLCVCVACICVQVCAGDVLAKNRDRCAMSSSMVPCIISLGEVLLLNMILTILWLGWWPTNHCHPPDTVSFAQHWGQVHPSFLHRWWLPKIRSSFLQSQCSFPLSHLRSPQIRVCC